MLDKLCVIHFKRLHFPTINTDSKDVVAFEKINSKLINQRCLKYSSQNNISRIASQFLETIVQ